MASVRQGLAPVPLLYSLWPHINITNLLGLCLAARDLCLDVGWYRVKSEMKTLIAFYGHES